MLHFLSTIKSMSHENNFLVNTLDYVVLSIFIWHIWCMVAKERSSFSKMRYKGYKNDFLNKTQTERIHD
jgi:hypothetical protein